MANFLLLAGLPGRMAAEVAEVFAQSPVPGVALLEFALTGPDEHGTIVEAGGRTFGLRGPDHRPPEIPEGTVAIDFTTPDSAMGNIAWYVERQIPFVLGTTGFDTAEARRIVEAGTVPAVIAPNMAIPIVLIQTALADLAARFPAAMAGYKVSIRESHQSGKKDTSGTAKALAEHFTTLGMPASLNSIHQERDPTEQREQWKVPVEHLSGHAYHYYDMESIDGSVHLGLSHCVHGRRVYAQGAIRALEFVLRKVESGVRGEVFNMTDVLQSPH